LNERLKQDYYFESNFAVSLLFQHPSWKLQFDWSDNRQLYWVWDITCICKR